MLATSSAGTKVLTIGGHRRHRRRRRRTARTRSSIRSEDTQAADQARASIVQVLGDGRGRGGQVAASEHDRRPHAISGRRPMRSRPALGTARHATQLPPRAADLPDPVPAGRGCYVGRGLRASTGSGIDLAGGTILVYEVNLERTKQRKEAAGRRPQPTPAPPATGSTSEEMQPSSPTRSSGGSTRPTSRTSPSARSATAASRSSCRPAAPAGGQANLSPKTSRRSSGSSRRWACWSSASWPTDRRRRRASDAARRTRSTPTPARGSAGRARAEPRAAAAGARRRVRRQRSTTATAKVTLRVGRTGPGGARDARAEQRRRGPTPALWTRLAAAAAARRSVRSTGRRPSGKTDAMLLLQPRVQEHRRSSAKRGRLGQAASSEAGATKRERVEPKKYRVLRPHPRLADRHA